MNNKLFFSKGHLSDEAISLAAEALYLDRVYDLPAAVAQHLEECLECKKSVLDIFQYLKDSKADIHVIGHPYFDRSSRSGKGGLKGLSGVNAFKRYLKVAAIIALMLVASFLAYQYLRSYSDDDLIGSLAQKPADQFTPSHLLESLVSFQARSEGARVLSPDTGQEFSPGVPITFSWETNDYDSLKIVILNNEGYEINSSVVTVNTVQIDSPEQEGLYYWKLEWDENILYFGKIYVR